MLPGVRANYGSYARRLVGMQRTGRFAHTAEPIHEVVGTCLRVVPEGARVPAPELYDVLNRHQCNVYAVLGRGADVRALRIDSDSRA